MRRTPRRSSRLREKVVQSYCQAENCLQVVDSLFDNLESFFKEDWENNEHKVEVLAKLQKKLAQRVKNIGGQVVHDVANMLKDLVIREEEEPEMRDEMMLESNEIEDSIIYLGTITRSQPIEVITLDETPESLPSCQPESSKSPLSTPSYPRSPENYYDKRHSVAMSICSPQSPWTVRSRVKKELPQPPRHTTPKWFYKMRKSIPMDISSPQSPWQ